MDFDTYDLDGDIYTDGVIPEELVDSCPHYRREMRGATPPCGTWVAICGTDIVREPTTDSSCWRTTCVCRRACHT